MKLTLTIKGVARPILATIISTSMVLGANAQDGEQLFIRNCSACHKMGTRLVGPDLTGVTERRSEDWIKSFITNSQAMVKAGDADAVAIFNEFKVPMTSFPLTDTELTALVDYLKGFGAKVETADAQPTEVIEEVPIEYTEEDVTNGRLYFQGGQRLAGGGPSCITCHNVTNDQVIPGGLLAKDLTNAYGRMGGHAGVAGILGAPPFPAMTNAYSGKAALTDEEIHTIAAFLSAADDSSDQDVAGFEGESRMLMWGFGGLILIFIWVALVWRVRLRQSVKEDILKRQLRSI